MRTRWKIVRERKVERGPGEFVTWIPMPYTEGWMELRTWKIPLVPFHLMRVR